MKKSIFASILLLTFVISPTSTLAAPSPTKQTFAKKLGIHPNEISVYWNDKLGTPSLLHGSLSAPSKHSPQWITYGFLFKLRSVYGLRDPYRDLQLVEFVRTSDDDTNLTLQQMLFEIPLYGATLSVHIDRCGVVRRVEGTIYPHMERTLFNRATHPAVSLNQAKKIASRQLVGKDAYVQDATLYYYPLRSGTQLIYEVTSRAAGSESIFRTKVHALMGHVIP
ncbi:hypothetical protein [Paenibacillus silvisoli]|uniref:hypothetical protein n=1 Tax=Paenibacillus silvisoli TaxID=3110539 RepID=UPI00280642AB|nr:hypothetical protein [Paenibacillus silvisoli]